MGQPHAGLLDLVDFDVIQAIGPHLDELDTCSSRHVNQLRGDIPSEIDDGLDAVELRCRVLLAIEDANIMSLADGGERIFTPGNMDFGHGMWQK